MNEIMSAIVLFVIGVILVGLLSGWSIEAREISIVFLSSVVFGSALYLGGKIENLKK
jgi:hypothetical protein